MKPSHIFFSLLLPFASTSIGETIQLSSATIPIDYLRNQTSINSHFVPAYNDEQEVVSHLSSRLQTCIAQVPSDHGLIFHIEDQSDEPFSIKIEEQGEDLSKRGVIRSMHKGWKAMPFDQRLAVVGSVAATAAVPMYLIGAGIGFNEYEISNLKEKLVSSNKSHHLSQNVLPPAPPYAPPAMKMGHRKRSWTETVQSLVKRGPPTTGEKVVKQPKVRNAKVDSVLGMVGVGNSFLYLGTAAVGMARSMAVRDSDTASYKRSVPQEMSGFSVNCIPVQKVDDTDFQIPKGGLNGKTKQLTYVDMAADAGSGGARAEAVSSGMSALDVATASLANGHHRVLVKRAAIPPREYDHNPSDAKQILLTSSSRAEQRSLHEEEEQPFIRRQTGKPHPHPEGHPNGGGPHPDADSPVHVMKVKHIHHVDPNAPKLTEKGHSVAPVKHKSNKKTALALAAGGAVVGAIGHSMYQSSQQQQQAAQAAAAAQAQVYGDDEAMYLPQDGPEGQVPPPVQRGYTLPDDLVVKRSVSQDVDSLVPLSKRSPGGGKPKPDIILEKHVYHHYNVHPDNVPAGAIHLNSEGGKRAPSSQGEFPEPVPPPGSGPESGPEAKHYYVTTDGKKHEHEKKDGEAQGHPKKKKMSMLKKGVIVATGAMAGAWGHAAMFPAPAPPAQVQGYYDDGTPVYQKRDLSPSFKKRSQMPMSIHQSSSSRESGTFEYQPDYLEYYNHLAKRDLVKRKTISYDDYVQSLKKIVEEDDDSNGKKVSVAVVQPAKLPLSPPSKRDKIDYDHDGKITHFSAQTDGNPADIGLNTDEEEVQPQRRNITFDADENNAVHFHASGPPASSKAAAVNVNEKEPSPDEELRRRADPVKIEYESNPDGSQYFSANTPVHKQGAAADGENVGEEDPVVMRRRSEVQNINFDHSKTGSHFAVTMKNNADEEDESPDLKEVKEMLQRRDHDGDHHHDIDYRTSKDNEVIFHASTPYSALNDAQAGSKEKGITIKIVPRSEDDAANLVRRNRIVADR